jgi:hypothetical protein
MAKNKRETGRGSASWRSLRHRLRLECRECEIICERVVSPWQCLKSSCPFVYVYEETDTSYFGCLHKVFGPELDLAAFCEAGDRGGRAADPYGSLRVTRSPRPECAIRVEQAYVAFATPGCCCNPTFFLYPGGSEETIRMITKPPSDTDEGPQS